MCERAWLRNLTACLLLVGGFSIQEADGAEPAAAPAATTDTRAPSAALASVAQPPAASVEPNAAASSRLPRSQRPEFIERQTVYYLEMFENHLKSPDWMARAMGVISLARIDDPRATERLLTVMQKDGERLVRVYAWEALHARQGRLTREQRALWAKAGLDLLDQDGFRGDLRLGPVGLIREMGPTEAGRRRFLRVFQSLNSLNPADIRTLWALGDTLKQWRDPETARAMVNAMSNLNEAYRAETVLRRVDAGVGSRSKLLYESSDTQWSHAQGEWRAWLEKSGWKAQAPGEAPTYTGTGTVMPAGEVMRDTSDTRWTKDLELRRFRLDQLDVGIALDTTASMDDPLDWVKRDVVKMMKLFHLVSREPRIGVTLYRDKGDKYLTKTLPLTDKPELLAAALNGEGCAGGGDIPEAVYEALDEVVNRQRWSGGAHAKKIVVLISDAPPHQDSLGKIQELATAALQKGFIFYTVKVASRYEYIARRLRLPNYDPPLATFDQIAQWGGGKSVAVDFRVLTSSPRALGVAPPVDPEKSPRIVYRDVLRLALEEGYKNRVDPFVNVLVEYIEDPLAERREAFNKVTPGRGGGGGRPSNPQASR